MLADLLSRKQTHFVLWRPGALEPAPTLYIGNFKTGNLQSFENFREIPLTQSEQYPELWEIPAQNCGLTSGQVYFYWFKVQDTNAYNSTPCILYCSDPLAWTVDRRITAPAPVQTDGTTSNDPASVVLYHNGQLIACDPKGQTANWEGDAPVDRLPNNNQLVIYELPTRWTRIGAEGEKAIGTGTFRDVLSLLNTEEIAPDFPNIYTLDKGHAHLVELGVNALELLPPADSDDNLQWGYGTANYFAADFNLGHPDSQAAPTASTDLVELIKACHQQGVRFFYDAVMAFSRNNPYSNINFSDFYIHYGSGDPEQSGREGFGGDLFKYNYYVEGYHPITGKRDRFVPAREYMKLHIAHWIDYYRVDGLRLDSVNNVGNYDFLQEFKDYSRSLWVERGGKGEDFLVVGEELSVPLALVQQNRLDGLWNERFKHILRQVILGKSAGDEPSFEWSVRKLIDCRLLGFSDGSQAVNYVTSHDVEGFGNERLYNYLENNGIVQKEKYIKLAFVCLLTAVGIPMILAGEEFADAHDLSPDEVKDKQVDPVNYARLDDDWRKDIFDYVARLVRLRTSAKALAVNETQFIHADFSEGKRVVVWQRGEGEELVVVVANFSDYGTPNEAEYVIPNWPSKPAHKQWREVTQDRVVPDAQAGREPIFPWEAKVYTFV
ncbi:alpha amylase [Microcoleus sp. FACHB-SPT15]|uniref:alpha-amylase family glycosyl hydrolase n=1 Tax=Microcoleus sp. FACHB-SPT15 TaxID=2692830 RepID=UPI00177D7411|nr:alpha-amylase family glycosyl hydrolase [Microcoleus sp. FACHB-SPT15]MBD1805461.1 alpha amylase [Microcoleus sp. FACHB-SPT15]